MRSNQGGVTHYFVQYFLDLPSIPINRYEFDFDI